jgi:pimeloyl-ACP methyl ester carboxylesterase
MPALAGALWRSLACLGVVAPVVLLAAPACAQPSTIDVTLDQQLTLADIYSPGRPASGAVVLVHGFMRTRATMADHAAALAADGVLAVVPDMPYVTDSRKNARALADLVGQLRAGLLGPAVERVVLAGFSAGGLSTMLAAATPGVVGYVGLDAFDRPGGVGVLQCLRHLGALGRRAEGAGRGSRDRACDALRLRIADRPRLRDLLRQGRSRTSGSRARVAAAGGSRLAAAARLSADLDLCRRIDRGGRRHAGSRPIGRRRGIGARPGSPGALSRVASYPRDHACPKTRPRACRICCGRRPGRCIARSSAAD